MQEDTHSLLADFQIAHLAQKYPAQLSGGESQLVNLVRAVATGGGRLLLLDEPFTGLDLALRDRIMSLLSERVGVSPRLQVLSVTHDVAEAFQLNAEVLKLREGRIVAQGPASEVLAEEQARLLACLGCP